MDKTLAALPVGASKQILYFKNLTLSTKVFINVVFPVPAYPFRINNPISLFDIRNLLNSPIAVIWSSVGENENLLIRTPLGGFINHSDTPNCGRSQIRIKPGLDKWSIIVIEDIEEGEELTLKYKIYDPEKTNPR